jgi:isoleucyl-tRNA synthetase
MTSRVTSFLADLTHELESYSLFNVIPAWVRLLDDLNNWYIRRGRRRYWRAVGDGPDADRDKADAYATLWRTLVTCVQAMAPVMPFVTEWLYQRLVVDVGLAPAGLDGASADASIHLAAYPEAKVEQRDEALERDVAHVRAAVGLALALREEVKIGVRRPLPRLIVASEDPAVRAAILAFEADLRGELNVKAVEVEEDDSSLVEFSAKANFKTLGKKLGKRMKDVASACEALDRETIAKVVRGESIVVDGETLEPEDVVVRRMPREGIAVASEGGITVVLDTSVDEALVDEGLARELVNRVQTLRKEADLLVSQRIVLCLAGGPALARALARPELAEMVKGETLTEVLRVDDGDPANLRFHKRDDIDGVSLHLGLEPTG